MATDVQEQIVREAPDIEQYKIGLLGSAKSLVDAANQAALKGQYLTPDYKVAAMSPDQVAALEMGRRGIGAYQPYLGAASAALGAGAGSLGSAASALQGIDFGALFKGTGEGFDTTRSAMQNMGSAVNLVGQGVPLITEGSQGIRQGQGMLGQYAQADLTPANRVLGTTEEMIRAAGPSTFEQARGILGQGIGALQGAAQLYSPGRVQEFMNPYQQQVIDEAVRQINRQGEVSQQALQAQAARAGAFGGMGLGAQQVALNRALAGQRNAAVTNALYQGYQSAAQQAQQAFEAQQARQLQQAQGLQGAAALQGQFEQTQQTQALQQAQALQGLGSLQGQLAIQQAQLGQSAAGLQGNLGSQLANLSSLYGNLGTQQANIYGQQGQLGTAMSQAMGNIAAQQAAARTQAASALGAVGAQQGQLGAQQGALAQQAQALQQQDVNMLYNLGASQQKQLQSEIDAARQNQLQKNMQPYQQLGFLSDIYKGAPTSQMSSTSLSQAAPSAFQQAAGLGIAGTTAAAAAARAGLL